MVKLQPIQRTCIYFLIGICIQAVALFIPWYRYEVRSNSAQSAWQLYLFEQWIPVYKIQPITAILPDMTPMNWFTIMMCAYIGVGIALGIYMILKQEITEENQHLMEGFMVLGPILSIALLFGILIICILSEFYIPYMQITVYADDFFITHTYSLSYGCVLSIVNEVC